MASEVISLLYGLLSSSASDTSKIWASAVRDVLCETLDNVPYLIETLEREGRISPRGDQTFNQETEHDEDEHLSNEHEWFFKARNVVASLCALGGFHKNVHSGCTVQVPQVVLLFRFIICLARVSLGGLNIYRKIPKISPGFYIFQRPFLRGLYWEGLIYGGKFAFQNRLD